MNIIFCNIVWMKKYQGITDSDKPKYFGSYVTEQDAGSDIFNFSEYNGSCYGYVRNEGALTPPAEDAEGSVHAADAADSVGTRDSADDRSGADSRYLVVWCAFKDKNTARIVGWYRNAVLFREEQYQPSFTNPDYELDYFFRADADDCFLLPENKRTFRIGKADKEGKGRGFGRGDVWYADSAFARKELIPEVLRYIETYDGPRDNFVLTERMLDAVPDPASGSQDEFLGKAAQCMEREEFLPALAWCNAAQRISRTPEVLYTTAYCLYNLAAFDRARVLLEECLQADPDNLRVIEVLAFCSDMTGDWDSALAYLEKMKTLTSDGESREVIDSTISEIKLYLEADI